MVRYLATVMAAYELAKIGIRKNMPVFMELVKKLQKDRKAIPASLTADTEFLLALALRQQGNPDEAQKHLDAALI